MQSFVCNVILVFIPETKVLADCCREHMLRMQSVVRSVRLWELRPGDSMQNAPPSFRDIERIFFCADGVHDAPLREVLARLSKNVHHKVVVICAENEAEAWRGAVTCRLHHEEIRRSVVRGARKSPLK